MEVVKGLIKGLVETEIRFIKFIRWVIIEVELPLLRYQEDVANKFKDYLNGNRDEDY